MAEFCVDCWNELNGTHDPKETFVLSRDLELCEGCGEWKHTIVTYHIRCFLWWVLKNKKIPAPDAAGISRFRYQDE